MIIYITARLFAWLYGYEWPLTQSTNGGTTNGFLALWSCITFPLEVLCAVMLWLMLREDKNDK